MSKLRLLVFFASFSVAHQLVFATGFFKNNTQYLYVGDEGNVVECKVGALCDISLAPNDVLSRLIFTDGSAWNDSASAKINYTDASGIYHVVLQPVALSPDNPVILVGATFQYKFNLKATKYSKTNNYVFLVRKDKSFNSSNAVIDDGLPLDFKGKKLDFKYYMQGDTDSEINPVKVFNDGSKTYIELPKDINVADLPTVYTFNNSGGLEQVNNARYRRPYFVIDGILKRYALLSGSAENDSQVRVNIFRGDRPIKKHWLFTGLDRN